MEQFRAVLNAGVEENCYVGEQSATGGNDFGRKDGGPKDKWIKFCIRYIFYANTLPENILAIFYEKLAFIAQVPYYSNSLLSIGSYHWMCLNLLQKFFLKRANTPVAWAAYSFNGHFLD